MSNCNSLPTVIHLPEVDSTSNYLTALSLTEEVAAFTVVSADYQHAGKGQRGNSWESERGKNLLFSILFHPDFLEVRKQFLLSKAIALAIKEVLDDYAEGFSIKWPNDIYWQEKKICGILIENDLLGSSICKSIAGIGLNINQEVFHSTAPNPVSLQQITGKTHNLTLLLNEVVDRMANYYTLLKEGGAQEINHRYHAALFRNEGFHLYKDFSGTFKAEIVEVKPEGTLVLRDEEGSVRAYAFKEVSYLFASADPIPQSV